MDIFAFLKNRFPKLYAERNFSFARHTTIGTGGVAATVNGVKVRTGFAILTESVNEYTIEEYSEITGVSVEDIERIAKEFTSHGQKVSVCHKGGECASVHGVDCMVGANMLHMIRETLEEARRRGVRRTHRFRSSIRRLRSAATPPTAPAPPPRARVLVTIWPPLRTSPRSPLRRSPVPARHGTRRTSTRIASLRARPTRSRRCPGSLSAPLLTARLLCPS